ncbi:MAG: uracil-DNA glycosylase [Pseudomonadota bacterium]
MISSIPAFVYDAIKLADVSWHPTLLAGIEAMISADPSYFPALEADGFLPTEGRLFAAFSVQLDAVHYVLVGEGPYPREASATGVCFMDGAVGSLWAESGLSKQVNRATSLRNFIKMLLVADAQIAATHTSGTALASIASTAREPDSHMIQTLAQLQHNLIRQGFLLLNATLVFRPHVPPVKDAKAWQPFLQTVLSSLAQHAHLASQPPPLLVLWGKIAEQLGSVPATALFPKAVSEHPYNLSFIINPTMQQLFAPMKLLQI